jgi:dTDP-4-dehydrorhamnose reductase
MKVAVIGANGQLGTDVVAEFEGNRHEVFPLTHADLDIATLESTRNVLAGIRPTLIVNTAAINALGARHVAIAARELGAKLLHVSTDYVFDGSKKQPYLESDLAAPLNVYGSTKLAGEMFIRASMDRYFILRTSALYGRHLCRAKGGRNFVELMLKLVRERKELRVVDDEIVSPTSTAELAKQILVLSQTEHYGLYHATAEGSCSWYAFAKRIFEIANVKTNLAVALPNEFPAKVPRPKYSVLENFGLKTLGINSFKRWEDGLHSYLVSTVPLN